MSTDEEDDAVMASAESAAESSSAVAAAAAAAVAAVAAAAPLPLPQQQQHTNNNNHDHHNHHHAPLPPPPPAHQQQPHHPPPPPQLEDLAAVASVAARLDRTTTTTTTTASSSSSSSSSSASLPASLQQPLPAALQVVRCPALIEAGHWVLCKLPSDNYKLVQITQAAKINLGKFGTFAAKQLIGKPFGMHYEIFGRENEVRFLQKNAIVDIVVDDEATNRDLVDKAGDSQRLSFQDIQQLKKAHLEGQLDDQQAVIKEIVANSATFEAKTGFSKQKYIKRKEKKFLRNFQALRPSAKDLCEYYFTHKPLKIRELRLDVLTQMLALSNVHAGSRLIVCDSVQGLLVGAVMERTAGTGQVFTLCDGDNPNYEILRNMNWPQQALKTLVSLPWKQLHEEAESEVIVPPRGAKDPEAFVTQRAAKRAFINGLRQQLGKQDFDGLIAVCQYDALEVVKALKDSIAGSKPVVLYSPFKEFLIPTFLMMRGSVEFINAQLVENFSREYQVPEEAAGMHPFMQTSGSGGFILSATRVLRPEPATVAATGEAAESQRAASSDTRRRSLKRAKKDSGGGSDAAAAAAASAAVAGEGNSDGDEDPMDGVE
ncbi:Gcd10p family-domain-containing protein [Zopfochytrium polystomum]|nr:Gcd10p family-domain-containing protein [Zopfochytrium polystomum]